MNQSTNRLLERLNEFPTIYDIENILNIRKDQQANNQELEKSFYQTKMGIEGEQLLVDFIEKFGENDWQVLRNIWVDYYGTVESDLILLTRANCYFFEVKNYTGVFSYQNGTCRLNGQKLANNCVTQAMRAHTKFQGLCREAGLPCDPKGILLFTGEHNRVILKDEIFEIEVLERQDLMYFMQKIKKEEARSGRRLNYTSFYRLLEKYRTANPFLPKPLNRQELENLRRGIYCGNCEKFEVELSHFYAKCSCGFIEKRDDAILRGICDYGVLSYDKHLRVGELYYFLNRIASKENIYRILRQNFEFVKKGRNSYYINKKLPYDKLNFPKNKKKRS